MVVVAVAVIIVIVIVAVAKTAGRVVVSTPSPPRNNTLMQYTVSTRASRPLHSATCDYSL